MLGRTRYRYPRKPNRVPCCVPKCKSSRREFPDLKYFHFPNDEKRCYQWVKVLGDPDLVHVPVEKLSTLRFVCSKHFPPDIMKLDRRSQNAVDPVFVDGTPLTEEQMKDFVGYARPKELKPFTKPVFRAPEPKQSKRTSSELPMVIPQYVPETKTLEPAVQSAALPSRPSVICRSVPSVYPPTSDEHITIEVFKFETSEEEESDAEGSNDLENLSVDSQEESEPIKPETQSAEEESRPEIEEAVVSNEEEVVLRPVKVDKSVMAKISPMAPLSLLNKIVTPEKTVDTSAKSTMTDITSTDFPKASSENDCCINVVMKPSETLQSTLIPSIPSNLNVYPIRLEPDTEVTSYLQKFVISNCLKAAFVLTCVGSVKSVHLRFATNADSQLETAVVMENMEICSLVGTVCADGYHLHGTFGSSNGSTLSGHILGYMVVETTVEIVIGEAVGSLFKRRFDKATGFRELVVLSS